MTILAVTSTTNFVTILGSVIAILTAVGGLAWSASKSWTTSEANQKTLAENVRELHRCVEKRFGETRRDIADGRADLARVEAKVDGQILRGQRETP